MRIAGFHALSLSDYPGVISAVVFTQGCVFRCPYCHNPELVSRTPSVSTFTQEEILEKLRRHRKMVEAVCVTGGEPTLHADLPEFLRALKAERFLVKLDTNGIHPRMIRSLIDQGLVDYVAMDLKHVWEKYETVTQTGGSRTVENCRETFELIQHSGISHEFRTTACPGFHTEEEIVRIGAQLQRGERYAIQPVRYGKTLDPSLPERSSLNIDLIRQLFQSHRPDLEFIIRV